MTVADQNWFTSLHANQINAEVKKDTVHLKNLLDIKLTRTINTNYPVADQVYQCIFLKSNFNIENCSIFKIDNVTDFIV